MGSKDYREFNCMGVTESFDSCRVPPSQNANKKVDYAAPCNYAFFAHMGRLVHMQPQEGIPLQWLSGSPYIFSDKNDIQVYLPGNYSALFFIQISSEDLLDNFFELQHNHLTIPGSRISIQKSMKGVSFTIAGQGVFTVDSVSSIQLIASDPFVLSASDPSETTISLRIVRIG